MEVSKQKITYVEHLSVINYLTKSIEDVLIAKFSLLRFPLLLVDLPLLLAVTIVNIERTIYTGVISFFVAHIAVDIRPVLRKFKSIIPEQQREKLLGTEEEEEIDEETLAGKIFQFLRGIIRFVWALSVFALFVPIWPVIFLYNFFVEFAIVGFLYYILIFNLFDLHGWTGVLVYYLIFGTVTFLVASISVPFILRMFIYAKYLFSLERKKWREVNHEAQAAFLNFYLQIQKNRLTLLEKSESRYQQEHVVHGGVYYLILKVIHGIKDYIWDLRKKSVSDLFEKIQSRAIAMHAEISEEKRGYNEAVSQMDAVEIWRTSLALLLTFFLSFWIASAGLAGHNMLASIFLSFIDHRFALTAWWNYQSSGMGYYEYVTHLYDFIPGFVRIIASWVDFVWGWFFKAYYWVLPSYLAFIAWYYHYCWVLISKLF